MCNFGSEMKLATKGTQTQVPAAPAPVKTAASLPSAAVTATVAAPVISASTQPASTSPKMPRVHV